MRETLFFGLKPDIPETLWGPPGAHWGARAIYRRAPKGAMQYELLHDRKSWGGPEQGRKELGDWLDKKGLNLLTKYLKKDPHAPSPGEDYLVRIEQDGFVLVANPRKSHGYLYLGAWKIE